MNQQTNENVNELSDLERSNALFGQQMQLFFRQLIAQLKLMHDCAWPLTALGLACSVMVFTNYARVYQLPLNALSSGLISVFPVVFAYCVLSVIAVAIIVFLPMVVFFVSPDENNVPLIGRFEIGKAEARKGTRRTLACLWVVCGVMNAMVLWGFIWWLADNNLTGMCWAVLLAFSQILVAFGTLRIICYSAGISAKQIKPVFYVQVFVVGIAHVTLMMVLYTLAISVADQLWANQFGLLVTLAAVVVVVLFLQLIFASFFYDTKLYRWSFKSLIVVIFLFTGLAAAIPPISAKLAVIAFQIKSPSGNPCLVLNVDRGQKISLPSVLQSSVPSKSIGLRVFIELDGKYYARPFDLTKIPKYIRADVHLIPVASVSTISDCRDKNE
ncbi:hypothetical protein CAP48_16450 [Advenella sp. S44]|uniref:hypothetical protein n=1 Tax=Advenella sp. S44 TaxID=1982755 RepID=UPI000C29C697|nr:hypothetical protein [Advenella sp. S44]PJX20918.1 hypothetical protein CAP48_16450 [Advenella sp. S44]